MGRMIDIVTKEIARNQVLELLYEAGELGASKQVITSALKRLGMNLEITEVLYYLESKELIKGDRFENKRQGIFREVYFITSKGIDFLDGNLNEVGLSYG